MPVADAAAAFLGSLGSSQGGSTPAQGKSQGGSASSQGQDPALPVADAAASVLGSLVVGPGVGCTVAAEPLQRD